MNYQSIQYFTRAEKVDFFRFRNCYYNFLVNKTFLYQKRRSKNTFQPVLRYPQMFDLKKIKEEILSKVVKLLIDMYI